MTEPGPSQARQIARAVSAFERERAGRTPPSIAVALGGESLVVTLTGALSPAERAVARAPGGAALLQGLLRALFAAAGGPLRQEVARITGLEVREAGAELDGPTGAIVLAFLLSAELPAATWSGPPPAD